MPSSDRRAAARRKAWGRGPIILRFRRSEGGDAVSVLDAAVTGDVNPPTEATKPEPAMALIGLRLLNDGLRNAETSQVAVLAQAENSPEIPSLCQTTQPHRVRRVIIHKAHSGAQAHNLRLFEPSEGTAAKRSRVPVSPS